MNDINDSFLSILKGKTSNPRPCFISCFSKWGISVRVLFHEKDERSCEAKC